eukprot:scaffold2782_cov182-Amphora_coffeaeformis.AAC.40
MSPENHLEEDSSSSSSTSPWRRKIALHRGWHRLSNDDESRPLENTRKAYIQAAELEAAYAECDVWATSDGQMVLSHERSFQSMVADHFSKSNHKDVTTPINQLTWDKIKDFELLDGSKPVLLSTVLSDLKGTNTRLALELKESSLALPLAKYLMRNPDLVSAIGFIMGFAVDTVLIFRGAVNNHPILGNIKVLWLVDNPSVPYLEQEKNEGETTFNYLDTTLTDFMQSQPDTNLLLSVGFHGLYIQYRSGLTLSHLVSMRQELSILTGVPPDQVFIGIWSDTGLDPDFDTPESLAKWAAVSDGLNTDCAYMKTKDSVPPVLGGRTMPHETAWMTKL